MQVNHFFLICDPESPSRWEVPRFLGKHDSLTVTEATAELAPLMRAENPDAVFVGIDEGDDESVVACRVVRRYSQAPIVMLISPAAGEQAARGYRLGADAQIHIPCDPREFHARLSALFRRNADTLAWAEPEKQTETLESPTPRTPPVLELKA